MADIRSYLVGGAVRDELLGLQPRERDWVVVGATPEAMKAEGYKPVGKDFPVFLHPETHEEYALARTERKTAPGYYGFECHAAPDVTLEEDLQRRDLTINAIARTADGELIDPWGGQQDIKARRLRHVSPAFAEDPVRILRVARFAARFAPLGFEVAGETLTLMRRMVDNGEVDALVPERVWQETCRALDEKQPAAFFHVLADCGALPRLFPWLGEDVLAPALARLEQAIKLSAPARVRLAAMLLATPEPQAALQSLEGSLPLPRQWRELAGLAIRLCPDCATHTSAQSLLAWLEAADAFRRPERLPELLQICTADAIARGSHQPSAHEQVQQALTVAEGVDTASVARTAGPGPQAARAIHEARRGAIARELDLPPVTTAHEDPAK